MRFLQLVREIRHINPLIHFNEGQETSSVIRVIYSTDGKLMLSRELEQQELSTSCSLNLENLSEGMYLLKLVSEKGNQQLSFIKE